MNQFFGRRNRVELRQPHSAPVHQQIEGHAAQRPRATAIQSDGIRLSYSELNQEANQLARRLQQAGVGRSSVVAVSIEPSADLVISLLAILKTGAAYMAVNPGFMEDHQALLFAGAHAGLLVTRTEQSKALPSGIPVVDCRDGVGSSENLNLLIEPEAK